MNRRKDENQDEYTLWRGFGMQRKKSFIFYFWSVATQEVSCEEVGWAAEATSDGIVAKLSRIRAVACKAGEFQAKWDRQGLQLLLKNMQEARGIGLQYSSFYLELRFVDFALCSNTMCELRARVRRDHGTISITRQLSEVQISSIRSLLVINSFKHYD